MLDSLISPASGHRDSPKDAYLSELLSYSLERLNKEPELLTADGERLRRQMQESAVTNYRAFISTAECTKSIRLEMDSVDAHLENLMGELPVLSEGCDAFTRSAQEVIQKRKQNKVTLANHSQLLDLLEIPQLLDTCVRNGHFDEALDLEAFVAKLAAIHGELAVVQLLVADVNKTTKSMLHQLLQKLKSNIQLPECLRVIGYLRRLSVFSEKELRLQFLKCREAWLVDIIDELDQTNSYEYLKRMTDCHRVHLFDVVMQYRAIFADDTSTHESTGSVDGGLLYSWAMHRIDAFLGTVRQLLPKVDEGGSLASVLDHCMYCGMSLGRVGLDFRGLLAPLFEECVLELFSRNLATAVENFHVILDQHRWVSLPSIATAAKNSANADDLTPPYSLMEHTPLAAFVNGVLTGFNELRHCAPSSLRNTLAQLIEQALEELSAALLRYNVTRMLRDSEATLFLSLCKAYLEVACPYLINCFGRLYPGGPALIRTSNFSGPLLELVGTGAAPAGKEGADEKSAT
eukprot:scaffold7998_cov417-Prasinococcus_capsulatus_cf.AAC.16